MKEAQKHMENGRLDFALRDLKSAVRLEPDFYQACLQIARILHHLGETESAVQWGRKAIAAQGMYLQAYQTCGGFLEALGRVSDAENMYRKAVRIAFDHPSVKFIICFQIIKSL